MHIWAENSPVDAHNKKMLDSINGELVTIIAHEFYPAHVSDIDINKALERGRCLNAGLDYNIKLKVDARVMLKTNVDVEDRLINGQIGTVAKIKMNRVSSKPEVIYVKFDDQNAGQVRIRKSGDRYAVVNGAVPITSVLGRFKVKENLQSSPEIQRTQFPLTLAWACTVHKVQGLTLPEVVFSFELVRQRQFNYGQVYVALSRIKALSDLSLVSDINTKGIRTDKLIETEYERLRASQNFDDSSASIISKSYAHNVVITLLNIRSLRKHYPDVRHDSKIVESDIMAFTETRLKDQHGTDDIKNALNEFQIIFQNQSNDFLSLAICVNSNQAVVASGEKFFPEVNGFLVDLSKEKIRGNMLLLYLPKDMHSLLFCNNLEIIVSSHKIKIVLGDFNINFYDETDSQHLNK